MEENIKKCCLSSTEKAPLVILRRLMALENVPMHGPIHHILLGASPLSHENWPVGIRMTGKALERISSCEGPRCCKRNCYHALTAAIAFASEELGVKMEETGISCIHSAVNHDCIGEKCPYYRA